MRRAWILLLLLSGCSSPSEPPSPPAPTVEPAAPKPATVRIDRANDVRESNAVALGTVDGSLRAFVADEDDAAIVEVDLEAGKVVKASPVASRIRDVLLLPDGRIAATLPDNGSVVVLARDATGALHEEKSVRVTEEPLSLAVDPDGKRLFVTTGAGHSLVQLDAGTFEERARWSLGREPRAALVTSDGSHVIVTHAAETFASIIDSDGKITQRDVGNRELCRGAECSGRRFARNVQAIARVGERGIVMPAAQMLPVPPGGFTKRSACNSRVTRSRGYGVGNDEAGPPAVSDLPVFDDKDGSFFGNGVTRFDGPQCLLPRSAAGVGDDVIVACLGSARLLRLRSTPLFDIAHAKHGTTSAYYSDGIVVTVRADAIPVPSGPTGIAASRDGKRAWVWSAFARALTPVDLGAPNEAAAQPSIKLARTFEREEAWLKGRELFFANGDKRISHDGRACANCHVDGRDDGLAWKTPMGMRRTRLLAGQTTAAPFGWTGENPTLDAHVQVTFKQLGGTGLPDDERKQLLAFVSSLPKPPSSPSYDDETQRGREVFTAAECATCHTNGASDRVVHDVGTGGSFLTPTLSGISARGRLMHDGRYRSLDELIVASTAMGKGSTLAVEDRRALIRYLATL